MGYSVGPQDYLSRAKRALTSSEPASLFYAAYELRCCIEVRQAEYIEALSVYKGTKIRPWRISETGRKIRQASNAGRIARSRYHVRELQIDSYHTPVSDDLVKFAETELGGLLHRQEGYRAPDDPWWANTREKMIAGYRLAWLSCQGDSHVPPLWNAGTREVHPVILERNERNAPLFEKGAMMVGQKFWVEIAYLDNPPSDWICDL